MSRTFTWVVLAAVGVVVIAGVIDAVRRSSSNPGSARANVFTVDGLTMTAPSAQVTTEAVATTQAGATTEIVTTTAPASQAPSSERLPSCATEQLRLTFAVSDGLAAAVLRRVKGDACRHGRAPIGFTVRDQSGDRIAVFGGNTRATPPADFSNGFEQVIEISELSCDQEGSFIMVATVGPYAARRTLPGAELPCDHG